MAKPKVNIQYDAPGYSGPHPDASSGSIGQAIFQGGGVTISKISPTLIVKHGSRANVAEAKSLIFIEKTAPSVPAPRVYSYYTIGPYDRDIEDFGTLFDTYIVMDLMQGQTLEDCWDQLGPESKKSIAQELKVHVDTLRGLKRENIDIISSVDGGTLTDPIFKYEDEKGPFSGEEAWNAAIVEIYDKRMPRANMRYHVQGALSQKRHNIKFTHGDLRRANILIQDAKLSGIIDWEWSGWYPEYWEFVGAFRVLGWPVDWPLFVSRVLEPHFHLWFVFDVIKQHLW